MLLSSLFGHYFTPISSTLNNHYVDNNTQCIIYGLFWNSFLLLFFSLLLKMAYDRTLVNPNNTACVNSGTQNSRTAYRTHKCVHPPIVNWLSKGFQIIYWRKYRPLNKCFWAKWIPTCEKMKQHLSLTLYINEVKWIRDLNVRPVILKLLEEITLRYGMHFQSTCN